jgi:thiamine pyrophosphate-dependent acetolactate synthase large subunit-like protein
VIQNGAQVVWESLVREGIDVVFGIPGGAVIPLYHFLCDYPIRFVLMRHEQAAIHAADGYARVTGRVGVCLVTSGPGATNTVTGLATARAASSPVVALTGQAPTSVLGTDGFQEVDIASITEPVTKHNYLVRTTQELPQVIKEAFYIARTGQPGPVLIAVATDIQQEEIEHAYPDQIDLPGYDPARPYLHASQDLHKDSRCPPGTGEGASSSALRTVLQQLLETTLGDIVLACDPITGMPDLDGYGPRVLLSPGSLQTKGFALPAAIGAQIAHPGEQVWVLAGDDGLQATIQELATVVQEGLPLRIAVINKGRTAAGFPKSAGKANPGDPLLGPNFTRLAEAYGIPGRRVTRWARARSVIVQALTCSGPVLVDFRLAGLVDTSGRGSREAAAPAPWSSPAPSIDRTHGQSDTVAHKRRGLASYSNSGVRLGPQPPRFCWLEGVKGLW